MYLVSFKYTQFLLKIEGLKFWYIFNYNSENLKFTMTKHIQMYTAKQDLC